MSNRHHQFSRSADKNIEICYTFSMKLRLVLHNIRSIYNVGAILRTAEGLGVAEVIFSGYTPRYDDPSLLPHLREKLNRQIAKSALGAESMVTQSSVADLPAWLTAQKSAGWTIVGLENNLAADEENRKIVLGERALGFSEDPELRRGRARDARDGGMARRASEKANARSLNKIVLLLGEEVSGIPPDLRKKCDVFLEIPMCGRKESFNVSVAASIALWELLKPAPA